LVGFRDPTSKEKAKGKEGGRKGKWGKEGGKEKG